MVLEREYLVSVLLNLAPPPPLPIPICAAVFVNTKILHIDKVLFVAGSFTLQLQLQRCGHLEVRI
jgi:hypothetical protein